jgi:hypothetical protein
MAYQDVMQRANAAFQSGKTKNVAFRRQQLENLMRMYEENREAMAAVLAADLRRPRHEAVILEIDFLVNDLANTLNNLEKWAEPEKVSLGVLSLGSRHSTAIQPIARQGSRQHPRRCSDLQRPIRRCSGDGRVELPDPALSDPFFLCNRRWKCCGPQAQ